jgi:hypothetical protein
MADNQQDASPNRFEKCIICKNETFIKKNQPISTRSCVITGLGQLCHSCFFAYTNTSTTYNTDDTYDDDIYHDKIDQIINK